MNYPLTPAVAGFLLAGGASRRMGRDKALLPIAGIPLLVHMASLLEQNSASIHILAPLGRYESFGFPILPDLRPNCGPLAGIEAALSLSPHNWSLILACDLPNMTPAWLQTLTQTALDSPDLQLVASGNPPNPLAALWHKSALPAVSAALNQGNFRVRDLLPQLNSKILVPPDPKILANWNEPADVSGG